MRDRCCPLGDRLEARSVSKQGARLIRPDARVLFRPANYLSGHATSGRRRLKSAPPLPDSPRHRRAGPEPSTSFGRFDFSPPLVEEGPYHCGDSSAAENGSDLGLATPHTERSEG